jgi:iron(III) transport system ATP-binding protein
MAMTEALLSLRGVEKRYGDAPVLRGAGFDLRPGEIGCLLGPSGCGKTTLLRCVAGFETVDGGEIRLADQVVASAALHQSPENRGLGMVFQDYALFPHLSVTGNVAFGLRKLPKREARERVNDLLGVVGLADHARKYPHELSGGQQQRVALARALAPEPKLLLLDEPFSNLDMALRERLSAEVRDILLKRGATAVMVTHSRQEAFAMADKVGVMEGGRIRQWGTPGEIYHAPADRFTASFAGEGVLLRGRIAARGVVSCALGDLGEGLPGREHGMPSGTPVDVLIRPEDLVPDSLNAKVSGVILAKAFRGPEYLYTLQLSSGEQVQAIASSHQDLSLGSQVGVEPRLRELVVYPAEPVSCVGFLADALERRCDVTPQKR